MISMGTHHFKCIYTENNFGCKFISSNPWDLVWHNVSHNEVFTQLQPSKVDQDRMRLILNGVDNTVS